MDCHHIQQNELHEKYLLGRLSKPEKSEYEKHLEGCEACREELAKQRAVIAGIRAAGRVEMKLRIRQQVGELRERQQSPGSKWQMILKIAAVLFIVALIPSALYYFRTESGEPMARLIKPQTVPANERRSEAEEGVIKEGLSKKAEEETSIDSSLRKNATDAADNDRYFADAISEKKQPKVTLAPKLPTSDAASGESGGGYGGGKSEANHQISVSPRMEAEETPTTEEESAATIERSAESELLSKLSYTARYKFAESQSVMGEPVRFDTKETAAQKYDALNSLPGVRGKQKLESGMPVSSTAVFRSGQKLITVDFIPPKGEVVIDNNIKLPLSFDVDILSRDSVDWKMNWYFDKASVPYDPSQMEIAIEGQMLYLIIQRNNIYRIDAEADTTKAVLLQK
jgi:hypothetical protein